MNSVMKLGKKSREKRKTVDLKLKNVCVVVRGKLKSRTKDTDFVLTACIPNDTKRGSTQNSKLLLKSMESDKNGIR